MAITRLGFEATRSLAFTLAVKQLFRGDNKMITRQMSHLFNHSSSIAALSFVLARRIECLDPERAQLGGLVHDIGGIPILHYADQYPELFQSEDQLVSTVHNLREIVGQWVLTEWEFDHELCEIPQSCRDWYRSTATEIDYEDIVTASLLHQASMHPEQNSNAPALQNVAIGRKLMDQNIDLSEANNFFDEAQEEIAAVKALIS